MRTLILVPLLFFAGWLSAQTVISGIVLDAGTDEPLVGANIQQLGSDRRTRSDERGRFRLECATITEVTLRATFAGYQPIERKVGTAAISAPIMIRLQPTTLPTVEVTVPEPEVVFQPKDLHVGTYHVNRDGLWVLVYGQQQLWHRQEAAGERVWKEARLYLLDTLYQEMDRRALPTPVRGMHRDHLQRTLVEGMEEAWLAWYEEEGIQFGRVDRSTLYKAVLPWTDTVPGFLLGSNHDKTYPAFDHIAHSLIADTDRVYCSVVDEHVMALFRSQYKYMSGPNKVLAMDLAMETGIDKEIIAGYLTGFPDDLYFHAPYAPMFVVHDTVCVFDHYKARIHRFTKDLVPLASVPIVHHTQRDWDGLLLQDGATDQVLVVFARNARTWIRTVDPSTGALGTSTPLTFPYPEELQVFDGWIYYVYRPYGSLQKRTLYRERIR